MSVTATAERTVLKENLSFKFMCTKENFLPRAHSDSKCTRLPKDHLLIGRNSNYEHHSRPCGIDHRD